MTESTTRSAALTDRAVRDLVQAWYVALDEHVDLNSVLPFVVEDGLEMRFPEASLHSVAEFANWYGAVTHRFFDEVHELTRVDVDLSSGTHADVSLVVNWQARMWNAPAPRSEWLGFDATQTWEVVADPLGRLRVKVYIVDALDPMPGSATL